MQMQRLKRKVQRVNIHTWTKTSEAYLKEVKEIEQTVPPPPEALLSL